jgi:hypothetical protein
MQDFIARININHFRELIEHEPDLARRQLLEELLAAEMAKLRGYEIASPEPSAAPSGRHPSGRQSQDAGPASAADPHGRAAPDR